MTNILDSPKKLVFLEFHNSDMTINYFNRMLSRTSFLVLHRIPALCASELMRRSVHTYVAADECILKQGEVYSTTATGTT